MAKTQKPTHIRTRWLAKQIIKGRPFPLDMLRYDTMVPATEADANIIEATITSYTAHLEGIGWNGTVVLMRFAQVGSGTPQHPRWASFGWSVQPISDEV